jgi:hypothetical protein
VLSRSLPLPWLRQPAVLLCCLLSVAAPFSESALMEVIEGHPSSPSAVPQLAEAEEPIDDEEDLLRSAGLREGRRSERKHALPQPLLPFVAAPVGWPDPAPTSDHPLRRAGSEHAFRNGFGSPLLC